MGNGVTKVGHCFTVNSGDISLRHDIPVHLLDQLHYGLGHSFCYIRPDPPRLSSNKINSDETTTFRSISGASVSANTSTPLSTSFLDDATNSSGLDPASTFESSDCFSSLPLQPVPRGQSGALSSGSGPIERGFLSGPLERGFLSGPIDRVGFNSGPIDKDAKFTERNNDKLQRSSSQGSEVKKPKKEGLLKILKRVISGKMTRGQKNRVTHVRETVSSSSVSNSGGVGSSISSSGGVGSSISSSGGGNLSGQVSDSTISNDVDVDSEISLENQNLQWAQGKAGEDRVHVVISEEHEWVFVGIYDGFNGPDAPDYLLSNLYTNVQKELKGLLWNDKFESNVKTEETEEVVVLGSVGKENCSNERNLRCGSRISAAAKTCSCEYYRERVELDWKLKERLSSKGCNSNGVNHSDVLKALSLALRTTEESYFEVADKMAGENPELALMGSCVLVMLMKGEDVYLMNVGDSRAVLAQKGSQDLEMICEESMRKSEACDGDLESYRLNKLNSIQLTVDHATYVDKEVQRIKRAHPNDASAVMNDRVKGYLKVTRAFGVGFLKQPKWNDLLLEMFRIDYIGTSPYITSVPFLHHHRLNPKDRFLILSSDGLYQYFTNEEAVAQVESFIATFPEGDPAQHLIEEVLFRAARKAGIDFHELLDIPQGERRRYHDDVSVIIISLEGRIWRSSV